MKMILVLAMIVGVTAFAGEEADRVAIDNCLRHWGEKHPFKGKNPPFRTIGSKVKVLGIGGNIDDSGSTKKPELVLIKPNVTVLAKTELRLLNPNGWYCLKSNVAVLGKNAIELHCKANLASSKDGATVLGGNDGDGGVTVLGASRINRPGCRNKIGE